MNNTEDRFWIVIDDMYPANTLYGFTKYSSFDKSKIEACKLATLHKRKFVVMTAIYGITVESVVENDYDDPLPF